MSYYLLLVVVSPPPIILSIFDSSVLLIYSSNAFHIYSILFIIFCRNNIFQNQDNLNIILWIFILKKYKYNLYL